MPPIEMIIKIARRMRVASLRSEKSIHENNSYCYCAPLDSEIVGSLPNVLFTAETLKFGTIVYKAPAVHRYKRDVNLYFVMLSFLSKYKALTQWSHSGINKKNNQSGVIFIWLLYQKAIIVNIGCAYFFTRLYDWSHAKYTADLRLGDSCSIWNN